MAYRLSLFFSSLLLFGFFLYCKISSNRFSFLCLLRMYSRCGISDHSLALYLGPAHIRNCEKNFYQRRNLDDWGCVFVPT